jgi:hypothetical protein
LNGKPFPNVDHQRNFAWRAGRASRVSLTVSLRFESMKTLVSLLMVWAAAWGLEAADPAPLAQEIAAASKSLSDQSSYSWTSTSKSAQGTLDWRQGPTEGKKEKDAYTFVSFTIRDRTVEMAFKGDKAAIKWNDQWRAAEELEGDYAWIGHRLKTYLFAAEEAAFLARQSRQLKKEAGGVYAGELNEESLQHLLSRGRRQITDVANIKGTVKFWLKDGKLLKYEYNLRGPVPFGQDQQIVPLDRTTMVEIKAVGASKVSVPEEARNKLK